MDFCSLIPYILFLLTVSTNLYFEKLGHLSKLALIHCIVYKLNTENWGMYYWQVILKRNLSIPNLVAAFKPEFYAEQIFNFLEEVEDQINKTIKKNEEMVRIIKKRDEEIVRKIKKRVEEMVLTEVSKICM